MNAPLLHLRRALLALGGSLAWSGRTQAAPGPLRFGMVPYLPAQQLVRLYEPAIRAFEQALSRSVQLQSAPDFEQFIETGRRGEFDLVGASPHVARLLHKEAGFLPLARATSTLKPLVVVARNSPLRSPADLVGHRLAVADRSALHVLIPLRQLRDQGIRPDREVQLLVVGNQRNAVMRMLQGETDAAITSEVTMVQLPGELTAQLRVLQRAPPALTPMAYLVHPRLKDAQARLREALLALPSTDAGRAMLSALQHEGLAVLTDAELVAQDPLVTEYYRQRPAR